MTFGTCMAYIFPCLAILALGVLVWADTLEEKENRRNRVNRFFRSNY